MVGVVGVAEPDRPLLGERRQGEGETDGGGGEWNERRRIRVSRAKTQCHKVERLSMWKAAQFARSP
jgi:hypothetical protein